MSLTNIITIQTYPTFKGDGKVSKPSFYPPQNYKITLDYKLKIKQLLFQIKLKLKSMNVFDFYIFDYKLVKMLQFCNFK